MCGQRVAVGVRLPSGAQAGEDLVDGAAQRQGIDRLDQPGVGLGLPGQPLVGHPVEEHHDPLIGDALGPLLEAQVETGGHATHVADLEVEHDQRRIVLGDCGEHCGAGMDPDQVVIAPDGGLDLVVDPVDIGSEEHGWHGTERTFGPPGTACRTVAATFRTRRRVGRDRNRPRPVYDRRRREPTEEALVLEIVVEAGDGYVLCRPIGELDAYTVAQFRESLTNLAEHRFILIDLSEVPFMDSAGLGALIGGIRRARENDGDVAVACDRPALTRLLHTTGFDRIVPVCETVEEAAAALGEAD